MNVRFAALICLALAAQTAAGTYFRLEVGPPVAAGLGSKVKKAAMVVRSRLCEDEASVQIVATAEGIVNGTRQSVALRLVALPTPGVHAVQQQWPDSGDWVVHLRGTCPATKAVTSTLVPIAKTGLLREKTQLLPQAATRAQVDAALADLARTRS
jgi:hypothetical protein